MIREECMRKLADMQTDISALKQEPKYCDRNICTKNEYNGIGCDECEVTKSQEPCGDLISRVEAIKAIEEKVKRIKNEDTLNGLAGAVNVLLELSSVNPQKLIPVSERLPQINEWVVCQCRANIYEVLKFTSYGWYHDDAHCYMDGFVIAWMPLPQSYRAEREEI